MWTQVTCFINPQYANLLGIMSLFSSCWRTKSQNPSLVLSNSEAQPVWYSFLWTGLKYLPSGYYCRLLTLHHESFSIKVSWVRFYGVFSVYARSQGVEEPKASCHPAGTNSKTLDLSWISGWVILLHKSPMSAGHSMRLRFYDTLD